MRTLILSCNTGGGHNSCARAIQEAYNAHDERCDVTETLRFVSRSFSHVIEKGHVFVYRHIPRVFSTGYEYSEKHPALFHEKSGFYHLLGHGAKHLHEYILSGGYDTVISVHALSALMLNAVLERYSPDIRTAFVATDYTCSPSTGDSRLDRYFIPSADLVSEFTTGFITPERIVVSGIPVRHMFDIATPTDIARREFGVQPQHRHIVVMCGSMGCGHIDTVGEMLAEALPDNMELSVVCGTNRHRYTELSERFVERKNVHILGFVKNMSLLMDSADLCVTKPGGLSVSEAAAKHLPLVLMNAVAGCETHNLDYFVSRGAAVTADTPHALTELCLSLLADGDKLSAMSDAMSRAVPEHAAETVFRTMCGEK